MNQRLAVLIAAGSAVLLAACGPATPSPAPAATTAPAAVSAPPTATSLPAAATPVPEGAISATAVITPTSPSPAATEAFPTPNPDPQCTPVPISADPNIKPVAADDWSKGPADAEITLIEYGDFQ